MEGKEKKWNAATAGLAQSINSPIVGGVIFLGIKCGMNFLYKGAGQSGRNGQCSWVVVIQGEQSQFDMLHGILDDGDPQCLIESQAWLQEDQCRRLGFTKLYDNAMVSCKNLLQLIA